MAKKIRAKLVMELLENGMSAREIQKTRHIALLSVKKVREAAQEKGVTWDDVSSMEDSEVYDLLFPSQAEAEAACLQVDYDYVHKELQRDGVNLKLLFEEHCDEARLAGKAHKSYATYCRGYSEYVTAKNVTNHLEHKPGQVMEVDWNGTTMRLIQRATGEVTTCYLFVACLPYSQYSYVEATLDMKQNTWLRCHVHAWEFFGGVAVRTRCDNLKVGVVSHPREGEIVLNEAYEALGRHYMTAIMPTGVRKPKQKASVEGTCGKVATAIVARLRNDQFDTLKDLNAAIRTKLDDFNSAPFQKRDGSRKLVFDEVESAFLAPLPAVPFEICTWVYGRCVNLNFHVSYMKNSYSVPHTLVGKKVDLKITDSMVDIYYAGSRVASHPKLPSFVHYRYSTDPSHMPPQFVKAQWDDNRILRWAKEIGPATHAVITRMFSGVKVKEQAYNPALAVLNLTKLYTEQELEDACEYSLSKTSNPRCKFIKTVLASNTASRSVGEESADQGGYLRGEGYYSEEGDEQC